MRIVARSAAMPLRTPSKKLSVAGFTLPEVMITMFFISVMCLGTFVGLQQVTLAMMNVAIRDEAYHLMQAEAERLTATDYGSASATASDQSITSSVKSSFIRFRDGAVPQFTITTDNDPGRITFTRRVVQVSSTSTSKTLRVEVQWTWPTGGRTNLISCPVFRTL